MDAIKPASDATLTPTQKAALQKLHVAAQGFESVFVGMLFKSMRETVSGASLTGKDSNADQMATGMLDDARAKSLSESGSLGIARVLERQLKDVVLAGADHESQVTVPKLGQP